ncbi:MAG: PTS sugar transporter subunit IIA [Spirochaetota bacterium]|nr:MAG: PTS sugar transporter subunit IIA [Spirochaetota bacterium]
MNLLESIREECIHIGSTAKNKEEVLKEIVSLALKSPLLSDVSQKYLFDKLMARERIGSTGFGHGIAIPHCILDDIEDFIVGVLIAPDGVEFESLDEELTTIFFFIIAPKEKRNEHIQILSSISKIVKSQEIMRNLQKAKEIRDVLEQLNKFLILGEELRSRKQQCLFTIFVQKEEKFEEILQSLSAAVQGSISVVESNNAGYYLYKLPLFASFWSEKVRRFSRVIFAVVDKDLSNDVIRRINMVVEDMESEPGVLLAVHDLSYSAGSIEF